MSDAYRKEAEAKLRKLWGAHYRRRTNHIASKGLRMCGGDSAILYRLLGLKVDGHMLGDDIDFLKAFDEVDGYEDEIFTQVLVRMYDRVKIRNALVRAFVEGQKKSKQEMAA